MKTLVKISTPFVFFLLVITQGGYSQIPPGLVSEILFQHRLLPQQQEAEAKSPNAIVASPDELTLYVTEREAHKVAYVEVSSGQVIREISLPKKPSGITLSPDGNDLWVTAWSDLRPAGLLIQIISTE